MRSVSAHSPSFTAALISPPGRGAVAVWRILGTQQDVSRLPFLMNHSSRIADQPGGRIWFGRWNGEAAVLTRIDAQEWELSIHGGRAAVQRVRNDLEQLGCTIAAWEELLRRGVSTLEAEYLIAATQTVTWTATEHLLRHPTRQWMVELQDWRHVFEQSPSDAQREQFVARCAEWLSWSEFGRHLTLPFTVALVGEPNVGKSSLLNRLAGFERAIVQDRPGTTRDLVAVDASFSGYPFSLTDTAGLRDTSDRLESEGISRTHSFLEHADLVLQLVDVSAAPGPRERGFPERFPQAILVAHKSDLPPHPDRALTKETLRVSALTGEGIDALVSTIVGRLIPRVPGRETVFPVTDRQTNVLQFLLEHGSTAEPQILSRKISELLSPPENSVPSN